MTSLNKLTACGVTPSVAAALGLTSRSQQHWRHACFAESRQSVSVLCGSFKAHGVLLFFYQLYAGTLSPVNDVSS